MFCEIHVTEGLSYITFPFYFEKNKEVIVHIVKFKQNMNDNLTLLISKASEALSPNVFNNHIGEGGTLNDIIQKQKGIRFIINGGFNHYRKSFYDWSHQNFNIGDPVGIVKIREHIYQDYLKLEHYGFLVQTEKKQHWKIISPTEFNSNYEYKYILGCTPLLIYNYKDMPLPEDIYYPVEHNKINPPSYLGHGLQHHPRTAIGEKNNDLYFIVIENEGCTLQQLQLIGKYLSMTNLLNLDGGGSSQFHLFSKETVYSNFVNQEDRSRILGHTLIIFDETLK